MKYNFFVESRALRGSQQKNWFYWVLNLRDRELLVYRHPEAGDYQSLEGLHTGQISPLAFPDVAIAVTALLPQR